MSKQNIEDIYPLSPAQQGMLMVLLLSGYRSEVYFEQVVATLEGRLDLAAWQRAWQEVVRRHPALRTQFVWERREQPLQVVRREVELPWQELDWSGLAEAEREERLAAFLRDDHARGFDLGKPPLLRIAMIRWEEDVYRLVWSFHHLVFDGWSISLVLSEAINLYSAYRAGRAPNLPAPRPYRSYIAWLQRRDAARAEAFWRQELAGFTEPTPLPLAGLPDPPGEGAAPGDDGWASTQEKRALTPEITAALDGLARRHGLTLNTVIQGAWGLLLSRLTGGSDVVFGAVVSGRPAEVEGIETMAGLFINALPVRVRVDAARELAPWLAELQERQSEQREYEHCLLEQVQAWSEVPRQTPLFESLLVFQNYPVDPLGLGDDAGFAMRDSRLKESTHYPLTMYVTPEDGRLQLRLAYHVQRFGAGAARRLLGWFAALLEGIARSVAEKIGDEAGVRLGELPLLSAAERDELLAAAAGPAGPAAWPVLRLFQEQAARTPQALAVIAGGGELTYAQLATRARRLGLHLRRLGVGAESVVGLCVERSLDMVVGMLGVLEAGGAYLPLDPAYPMERLAFMLRDSGARVLLTQDALVDRLPEGVPGLLAVVCLDSDWPMIDRAEESPAPAGGCGVHNPVYVIYTSGSTGQPKGVVVEHASLANYVASAADEYGIAPDDRVLQFASMSFDTSAEEIYPCLTRGATLVLRDGAMASSPDGFVRELERLGITVLDLPTAYWHEMVAEMERQGFGMPDALRLVILGGEQAQTARFAAWKARVGDRVRLVNTYGPTEATIVTTQRDLTGEDAFPGEIPLAIPIGRPVRNARAYVVARGGWDLVPAGVDGELWIGGAGLARGYLGRPDLTAERFVPNPFAARAEEGGRPGERLYRTGDLVRLLPDGDLEFRGRVDHQVKVRGFRIELGEVEAALRRLPGVREAVAGVQDGEAGQRLVAWIEAAEGERPTVAALRQGLKELLPDHMVPTAFVVLDALPLTPSGKLDRRALPSPDGAGQDAGDFAAPRTPVEEVLAGIWSEVLKVERVGVHDDFFVLGGHSLLVGQVVTRVRQALAVELPLADVFRRPTVAGLAEIIEQGQLGTDLPELPPIVRQPRDGRTFPLSFPQERVWFLDQLSVGGNIAYNFQVAIWFHGALDIPVLERSLGELLRRHEVLRTSFPAADGLPVQVIHPAAPVSLELVDLSDYPEAEREEMAETWIDATVRDPFDVATGPLIRWRLLRLAADHHALVQVEHHFVHDGWSFGVLLRELKAIYGAFLHGEPSPLPELPVQYADFSVWQRQWLEGEVMERLLGFWRQKLAGHPPALEIPGDRPRPARPKFQGRVEMFLVRPDLYEALRRFGRREGFTFYMTMLSGFFSLLYRYTGQEDVVIGSSNANRRAKEIEGMIGMVVNTLVLRGDLRPEAGAEADFRKVLARVRELTLEVYAHQDMPFERLVKDLKIERQIGRNPLFQIMFNFHNASVPDLDFGDGLSAVTNVRANRSAKMDMNIIVVPRSEQRLGLAESEIDRHAVLHWEWNTDLYDFQTIERMVGHYQALLEGVVASPNQPLGELPLLTAAEREQLAAWAETGTAYPREATIPGLFEACAEASPGSVAVELGDESLTYADLNRRANRLAHHLRRLGAGPGQLVGLCAERSLDLVPAILGILKSGAAYAPLDPSYPAERLAWMLADTGAKILVGHQRLLAALPEAGAERVALDGPAAAVIEGESSKNPVPLAGAGDLAYVMYTSGSTGRPKGVAVSHRNVVRLVRETNFARFGPEEVFLQLAPVSFDASTLELWGPLLNGGRLAIFPPRQPSLEELGEVIARHGVTTLWLTAGLFHQMVEGNLEGLRPVRQLLAGGDVLSPPHVRRVLAELPGTTLINGYGPTEGTTFTCCHAMTAGGAGSRVEHTVPIGRPISNTRVHVVDGSFRPLPVGLPGELLVGGDGLAVGYLGRPELTAARFVPDPFGAPGGRLYRTGDQARWLADGTVEFFGRRDGQVKIRGYRIETGEIEAALAEHPEVREAAVVAREDADGDRRLVAYVATAAAGAGDSVDVVAALRAHLEARLPAYMVPAAWVVLESLPLTENGKVDRRALPAPEAPRSAERIAPRTPTEAAVADIWREVLKVESVGVGDDFFALGGHSLAATRVLSRLRKRFGAQLSLANVFECSTLELLAAAVDEAVGAGTAVVEAMVERIPPVPAAPAAPEATHLSDDQLDALLAEMMTDGGAVELPK